MMLRQCKFSRPGNRGKFEDVFWIDNALAKIGKKVVDEEGIVWTIEALYNAKEYDEVMAVRDDYREMRDKLETHR